jgi:hypothetical protein
MRTIGFIIGGGLAGLICGFVLGIAIGLMVVEIFGVSSREGGAAMLVLFGIAPLVSLIFTLIGAISAGIATARRARLRAEGNLPPRAAWSPKTRVLVGIAVGLVVGYAAGIALMQAFDLVRGSRFYATYAAALMASWVPVIVALAGGALGIWIGGRARPPITVP